MPELSLDTPVGRLTLVEEAGAIVRVFWGGEGGDVTPLLVAARDQMLAYFDGRLTRFDLPLRIAGTESQRRVCAAMQAIPFGETRRYGDLARELGLSAQAVGRLCGRNPIPVIVPCHRVLGAAGLGGYSGQGGIETKVALLRHEGAAGLLI
jgi:methylated-DNA-[protein]-cysteine S-methyltransferase